MSFCCLFLELLRSKDDELRRTLEEKSRLVAELRVIDRGSLKIILRSRYFSIFVCFTLLNRASRQTTKLRQK